MDKRERMAREKRAKAKAGRIERVQRRRRALEGARAQARQRALEEADDSRVNAQGESTGA